MTTRKPAPKKWMFKVAGVQHHYLHKCIDQLEKGSRLHLVCEPTNKYDKFAVQVVFMNNKDDVYQVGYVPKGYSEEVTASLVRPGKNVHCEVAAINPDEKPWNQLVIFVKEVD